jgi:epoxyqueuosine reductase QueG
LRRFLFSSQTCRSVPKEPILESPGDNVVKRELKRLALDEGAGAVGVASADRLGGVASMDPNYLLPGACSIVSLMLPLDGDLVRRYLSKDDHDSLERHEVETYRGLYRIGQRVASFLHSNGYRAVVAEPNLDYRYKDTPEYTRTPYRVRQGIMDWFASESGRLVTAIKGKLFKPLYKRDAATTDWNLTPSFSHRYGAVAAGIGTFGWSGNVLHPDHGARVYYNTVVTDAPMKSDPYMKETPCDGCRYCARVCQSGMIHMKKEDRVRIGGKTFTHNKKGHNLRCIIVCGGLSGQSMHKGWSTWSPGRITVPDTDENIETFWNEFVLENGWKHNYYSKVLTNLVYHAEHGFIRRDQDRMRTTCGFCQFVCSKTRKERKENYEAILASGEVVEGPGFSFRVAKSGTP